MNKGNLVRCMKTNRQGIVVDVSSYTYWVEARPIKIVETKRAKIVDNNGFFYAIEENIKIISRT